MTAHLKSKNSQSSAQGSAFVLIIITGLIAYWNSFQVPFQFDDYGYAIIKNKPISNLTDFLEIALAYPARAICQLSFALNLTVSPKNLFLFHFVNWLIHIGNTILLFFLVSHLLGRYQSETINENLSSNYLIALFCSLIFVSHPIHTQAVTYLSQRYTSLVAFFSLASIFCYIRYTELRSREKTNAEALLAAAAGFGVAANLTKETAASLPLIWLSVEWVLAETRPSSLIQMKWPVFSMIAVLCLPFILLFWGNNPSTSDIESIRTPSTIHYTMTQVIVLAYYFRLFFIPVHQNLDYDFPVQQTAADPVFISCFLIHCGLLLMAVYSIKGRKIIAFGIFIYYIALLPESSLMALPDVIFEHRLYLPSFGILIVMASLIRFLLSTVQSKQKNKRLFTHLIICLFFFSWISTLTVASNLRNEVWQTRESLWLDVVQKSPHKLRPHLQLGAIYMDLKQYEKSGEHYRMATRLGPWFSGGYNNLGIALIHSGKIEEAIDNFNRAISIEEKKPSYWRNLGHALQNMEDFDKAEDVLRKCVRRFPAYGPCRSRLEKVREAKAEKSGTGLKPEQ